VTVSDIVRMANQISDFFNAYPHDEAVRETATHMRNFWDPRMRAQLSDHLAGGGEGLSKTALEAARLLQEQAETAP
jgi:formate dehydrogenase subunit delta